MTRRSRRGQQCWQVLAGCAANRQLSGYELLGDRIGMSRHTLAQPLGCVFHYCEQHGLPPLTVLVVDRHGKRGSGFLNMREPTKLDALREQVFAYAWDRLFPPSADELETAFVAGEHERGRTVNEEEEEGATV
jgi:hypothetical protein